MANDWVAQRVLGIKGAPFVMDQENAEVFAWYGQAVALAQFLEASLIAYLATLPPAATAMPSDPAEHFEYLETLDHATLRRILAHLKDIPELQEVAKDLEELKDLRNDLIHNWFRVGNRDAKFSTDDRRRELVAELQGVIDRIGAAATAMNVNSLFLAFPQSDSGSV